MYIREARLRRRDALGLCTVSAASLIDSRLLHMV
jgi:hypothetical protein